MLRWWIVPVVVALGCAEETREEQILALEGDSAAGSALYDSECAACHATDGTGVEELGPDIRGVSAADVVGSILEPPTTLMSQYAAALDDQEIADVAAYAESL